MRGTGRKAEVPRNYIPSNGSNQASQDNVLRDNVQNNHAGAQSLSHIRSKPKGRHKIEEAGPHDREARSKDPGRNYRGNGVGGVVKSINEVENKCNKSNEGDE